MQAKCATCNGKQLIRRVMRHPDANLELPQGVQPSYISRGSAGFIAEWNEPCPVCGPPVRENFADTIRLLAANPAPRPKQYKGPGTAGRKPTAIKELKPTPSRAKRVIQGWPGKN